MKKSNLSNLIILISVATISILIAIESYYKFTLKKRIYNDAIIVNQLGKIRGNIQRYTKLKISKNKKYNSVKNEINSLFEKLSDFFSKKALIPQKYKKEFFLEFYTLKYLWNNIQTTTNQNSLVLLSEKTWSKSNVLIDYFEKIHKLKFNNLLKNIEIFIFISIVFLIFITLIVYIKIKKGLEIDVITDKLTQLYNRFYFNKQYDYLINKSKRNKFKFSMIIIDIDNFKKINDTYGHKTGDKILKEMAQLIKDSIRKIDMAFRYGGEELVILLPNTDLEKAKLIADRIRNNISQKIKIKNNSVTISAGVGMYNKENELEFFKKVDEALYMAKKTGKNKVIIAPIH